MKRLSALIAATLAALTVALGVGAVDAVATPTHFYRCVPYPLGNYKDSKCQEPTISGSYKRIAFTEGTAASYTGTQTSNHVIAWTAGIFGIKATVTCKTAATSGTLENPSGGGAGTVRETQIKFGECTATAGESKCTVVGGGFTTHSLKGATTTGPGIELKSESGGSIAEFTLESCLLSGTHELTGTAVGTFNNKASSLEFTTSSGSSLAVDLQSATLTGSDTLASEEHAVFVE